jgi:hypothetical protein
VEQTKARAGESLSRINGSVADYANKKYWTQAQNEVRRRDAGVALCCGLGCVAALSRAKPWRLGRCAPMLQPPRARTREALAHVRWRDGRQLSSVAPPLLGVALRLRALRTRALARAHTLPSPVSPFCAPAAAPPDRHHAL